MLLYGVGWGIKNGDHLVTELMIAHYTDYNASEWIAQGIRAKRKKMDNHEDSKDTKRYFTTVTLSTQGRSKNGV